ncbi:MAG: transposase [Clostridium sp.]|uniref:transposase n=1 Tax=Clostridium sp. TaxID=1506 RepID=UPI00345B4EC4|nr:transposase [Clostridium sp.]
MFPPAYSSEFNLIEGLWRWLKSSIINNSFFPTFPKVRVPVNKFIDEINRVPTKTIDRLCLKL